MKEVSQFRRSLKFSYINKVRWYVQSIRLGSLGRNVFIDKDVSLLRFPKNIFIGDQVVLKQGANICSCNESAKIRIGDRTTIGFYTFIYASSNIVIGSDCLIAPFVYIVDSDHNILKGININQQPNTSGPIEIGNDVWIATGVKILKGVRIGDGAVIAAGSLVNSDVPENCIYGGIPARKIGERK